MIGQSDYELFKHYNSVPHTASYEPDGYTLKVYTEYCSMVLNNELGLATEPKHKYRFTGIDLYNKIKTVLTDAENLLCGSTGDDDWLLWARYWGWREAEYYKDDLCGIDLWNTFEDLK